MSASLLTHLISELRSRGLWAGTQEMIALATALSEGLHDNSLEQFYYVARTLMVHDESDLDEFDQVFSHVFKGVPYTSKRIAEELREWLQNPIHRPELTEEEKAAMEELDVDELLRRFEERLREQTERHDGGSYWIGTGGRSPFGTGGFHRSGISLRNGPTITSGGGRSLIRSADARRYRGYRQDLVLDVRQIETALRKLRTFDRQGIQTELDLPASIDATARNFGELELVFSKPRRPNTRVILMMDVGGSMDPYAALASQLFSAAKRATHWKELRTYYFHNCIYGRVYRTDGLRQPLSLNDLMRECDARYKLIFVGDAAMAPYELMSDGYFSQEPGKKSALDWFIHLRKHFPDSIWLNPDTSPPWSGSTAEAIARIFPTFPLTLEGLDEGLRRLKK